MRYLDLLLIFLLVCLSTLTKAQSLLVSSDLKMARMEQVNQVQRPESFTFNTNAQPARRHFSNGEAIWYALGIVGGYMVCSTVIKAATDKNPNWAVAGVGGGLICLSVTCALVEKSRRKKMQRHENEAANLHVP